MWLFFARVFLAILVVSLPTKAVAIDNSEYSISVFVDQANQYDLGAKFSEKSLFEAKKQPFIIPRGIAVWIRVDIAPRDFNGIIQVQRPAMGRVEFYALSEEGTLEAVQSDSFFPLPFFNPHLRIDEFSKTSYFFKVTSPYVTAVETQFTDVQTFNRQVNQSLIINGAFVGMVVLTSVYMFASGWFGQRRSLIATGAYLLSLILLYATYRGLSDVFVAHDYSQAFIDLSDSMLCASLGFALLFFYFFLSRRRLSNFVNRVIKLTAYGMLGIGLFIGLYRFNMPFAFQSVLALITLINIAFILSQQTKSKELVIMCLCWSPVLVIFVDFAALQVFQWQYQLSNINQGLVVLHLLLLMLFVVWHDANTRRRFQMLSEVDKETGLPNKSSLMQVLARSEKHHLPHTLILFKPKILPLIKLNFGISYSNLQIRRLFGELARQLNSYSSAAVDKEAEMPIYRVDEHVFALVLGGKIEVSQVEQYVCILSAVFEDGIELHETQLVDELEVGVANYPMHAKNSDKLIQRAMQALSTQSLKGRRWHLYDVESSMSSERRLKLTSHLKTAIEQQQMSLFYQPQICLRTGKLYGAEALLRWNHPEFGYIPPDEFIPLAESSGQIYRLTEWVVEQALLAQVEFTKKYHRHVISFNISSKDLATKDLSVQLITLINELSLAPSQIIVEVTESVTIGQEEEVKEMLNDFKSIGVKVAIDDFGTGYSSLAYLSNLGFDELKIDKGFVMGLESSQSNQTICKATCDMAHNLGSQVVAEGVEDLYSYAKMKALGCDIAQGYFISRPINYDEYQLWVLKVTQADDIKAFLAN
ncbi:putative bifunctional diguanylate cyclase/phosphodiesterase [Pseudoalteromonas sp. T1lg65]|uniref:putative bifunctional diguanylate cyclase/phosphodiesterase n=1 Tax=Pseudoalteromonas sp. T1lg65 TaxID=2077101 RepID=UPI003F790F20